MENKKVVVMVVSAHPDDSEFAAAGTVAKWAREGRKIIYAICTNGDKGSADPNMTSERLAKIRGQTARC
jgi:LmbE family N-acetylglucosaminyl deacetylase